MSWMLVAWVAVADPAWTVGTAVRAEQRVGTLLFPESTGVQLGAALSLRPALLLQLEGPRTALAGGYTPFVFLREGPGEPWASVLHQLELGVTHRASRRLRLSLVGGWQGGALQYTQDVGETTAAGRPPGADVDMLGAVGTATATFSATRRVLLSSRVSGGYLGPGPWVGADAAALSYPPQAWIQGNVEAQVAMTRLCGLAGEARVRHVQFFDGPQLEIAGWPLHWRCRAQRASFGLTAGVGLVRDDLHEPALRVMPMLGARGETHLVGPCEGGGGVTLEPVHDPLRRNVASRASLVLSARCGLGAAFETSLESRLGLPTPLELRADASTPAQDTSAGLRLAAAWLATDDTALEVGTQTTWRSPPDAPGVVEVIAFFGARASLGFGPGQDSKEEEEEAEGRRRL